MLTGRVSLSLPDDYEGLKSVLARWLVICCRPLLPAAFIAQAPLSPRFPGKTKVISHYPAQSGVVLNRGPGVERGLKQLSAAPTSSQRASCPRQVEA
jgi:hypothetical protein